MKSKITFLLVLFSVSLGLAQQELHTVPSSPAFSVLNFEPTSVLRPTSPAELKANILNSFDDEGKLKPNLGIEFAPYWLSNRDSLTEVEYFNPNTIQTIKQTFQFSAAVVNDSVLNNNKLGLGLRFQILQGKPSPKYSILRKQLQQDLTIGTYIAAVRSMVRTGKIITKIGAVDTIKLLVTKNIAPISSSLVISKIEQITKSIESKYENTKPEITAFIEELQSKYDDSDLSSKVMQAGKERIGLIVEVGGGTAFQPEAPNEDPDLQRFGFWVTAAENVNENNQFAFSIRYLQSEGDSAKSNFDVGLSYTKNMDKFSLSFEGMGRWFEIEYDDFNLQGETITRVEDDFTYRLATNFNYKLNEYIFISASFGKAFDDNLVTKQGFFSIFGINYNLFKKSTVELTQ